MVKTFEELVRLNRLKNGFKYNAVSTPTTTCDCNSCNCDDDYDDERVDEYIDPLEIALEDIGDVFDGDFTVKDFLTFFFDEYGVDDKPSSEIANFLNELDEDINITAAQVAAYKAAYTRA